MISLKTIDEFHAHSRDMYGMDDQMKVIHTIDQVHVRSRDGRVE